MLSVWLLLAVALHTLAGEWVVGNVSSHCFLSSYKTICQSISNVKIYVRRARKCLLMSGVRSEVNNCPHPHSPIAAVVRGPGRSIPRMSRNSAARFLRSESRAAQSRAACACAPRGRLGGGL